MYNYAMVMTYYVMLRPEYGEAWISMALGFTVSAPLPKLWQRSHLAWTPRWLTISITCPPFQAWQSATRNISDCAQTGTC